MAQIIYKAFLSCSFAPEDTELNEFFQEMIHAFDIETEVYNYQEIGRLTDKVKESIIRSDCLIAIATRRTKLEGSECWACSEWIRDELSIANASKKPVAIFLEKGVKIEGLIALEERRQEFCRDNLLQAVPLISKFLFKLRLYLESFSETLQLPLMLRHYVHVHEELPSPEHDIIRCEVLMECLAETLEATHHFMELDDSTPGLSIKPMQFQFVCEESPPQVKVKPVIVHNTDSKYMWRLDFSPPLHRGEKVKYAFKIVRPNTRPWTYEELSKRITQGTYGYDKKICKACEWSIKYPTAEFIFTIDFPEGYEISEIDTSVRIGDADIIAESETKRIREGGMFSAEKMFDKWSLSLKVPRPLQDHTYYVHYMPPPESPGSV